ncbi:MAG: family 10 glycosylhydrolase [Chthonomonadales bacterium]|nr:family 10 glycosylhydrolase [Chthonomonadales bacterium]
MRSRILIAATAACALAVGLAGQTTQTPNTREAPPIPREFRAAWVATVANIDWPSAPGLPVAQQKAELVRIIDTAAALKLNALIFQVRPACDALYASKYEPWSEYLTGVSGKAPDPPYDPLQLAIEEAHKRGIELHAWFNPYRARHPSAKSPVPPNHVSKTRPEIVRTYGKHLWLDPADPRTRKYSLDVIMDVVRRYDVDGIHLDDYFYPYKEKDAQGRIIDFPDDRTWASYRASGGKLSRDDWRRDSVNQFIASIYGAKQALKPHVKFGISPFGIWRPGNPAQIQGFDAYAEIYADSRLWLQKGWVDYFTPQLYWAIGRPAQSYPVLLRWWAEQNTLGRNLWPGNFTSRIKDGASNWAADEILAQIQATRDQPGAGGNVHFSMRVLLRNLDGIADKLKQGPYADHAVPPASPWLSTVHPSAPRVQRQSDTLRIEPAGGSKPWLWVVQTRAQGKWQTRTAPATQRTVSIRRADEVIVRAVDRVGNESPAVRVMP